MRTDLTVNGVTILEQKETPGLGTRVEEVASDVTWILILTGEKTLGHAPGEEAPRPWFTEKYRGLAADAISLTADGGAIDAITGATVSSRAVTDAVRTAVEGLAETLSGAK